MRYQDIKPEDVLVMRFGARDQVVQVVAKKKWTERLKQGRREHFMITVKRQNGSEIDVSVDRLLTLSEAQARPVKASDVPNDHPPRKWADEA